MLLTLDTWLVMAGGLREKVLEDARQLADADNEILEEDRRPVVFASAPDFELLFARADEDAILQTLEAAVQPEYIGWLLPQVRQQAVGVPTAEKPYPFQPGEILPWWDRYNESDCD